MTLAALAADFRVRFGAEPRLFRAPGRINIIGEHTDYSEGFVLPAAIDRWCVVAAAPNDLGLLRVVSQTLGREMEARLDRLAPCGDWTDYVAGPAKILLEAGLPIAGADMMIASDVPVGAGVSSSAALQVAVTRALLALSAIQADGAQVATWARASENRFVGMPCGIMDSFASANGVEGGALMLDCRSLQATPVPLPDGASFLLVNSMVDHQLVAGEYKQRREDCEAAARTLGVPTLRDVAEADLPAALQRLSGAAAKRCRHVVTENARVGRAVSAMTAGDLAALGALMNQSHASLRDDMEVSLPVVDQLAAIAQATPGVHGARLMGGGFGGCVIALVDSAAAEAVQASIVAAYGALISATPDAFACRAVAGASEVFA
ncbi:MAG: galactokinase [Phenylobacterium sp.]|uniref:galactokinase n=1 Tax=Phenylobacterium sp. TaxID=1871053 RepID=UPI002723464E|nr:galactokinase [Phenylobacterium sp.]MDO8911836.1 galactokinase [Phenylobacterium sp.]MDP3102250.1 galactokinase [Phenylobacterium sp.]